MNILGALTIHHGDYILDGELVSRLRDDQLADIRNRMVGFVFQVSTCCPAHGTSNVELPLRYSGVHQGWIARASSVDAWGFLTASVTEPTNCLAVSSSGWHLPAPCEQPGHFDGDEPTATWIRYPARKSWICSSHSSVPGHPDHWDQ
jgi:hypothetical protein